VGEQTEILNLGEGALEHLTPGPDGCSFDPWTDPVGDLSFSANTLVLLASGKSIPIGQVKVGDKVLATNTKTGRTQAEAVMAVMVHHDSDLFDLKITDRGKTAVIRTTSNHPFWVPAVNGRPGQWVTAGDLKPGTRLRTPSGSDTATVVLGWIPKQCDGWMWDLTIPGNNDHDFYIDTTAAAVLVHNCGGLPTPAEAQGLVENADPVGSALKGDASHRSASWAVGDIGSNGTVFRITGGDGVERLLIQVPGEMNRVAGRFEWILDGDQLTHEMFVRGGTIKGIPIKP
jgi:hypothetical protein